MSYQIHNFNVNGQDAYVPVVNGSLTVNNTNMSDNEDLITIDNKIKFADKTYDPTSFSGLGKIYLRKNIINSKNILTQDILNKENTIYIIQYDYDLNGQNINIPANSIIYFHGGSLSNGSIILNSNTTIYGNNCIITANIILHDINIKIFNL